jgi:predicted nucleic acid-binding protein
MKYCLDTNVCIGIINNRLPLLRAKLRTIPSELIVVCSVVRAEL